MFNGGVINMLFDDLYMDELNGLNDIFNVNVSRETLLNNNDDDMGVN